MTSRDVTGALLLALAALCLVAGLAADRAWLAVGLMFAIASGAVLVLAPSDEQRDAARRNHARPMR